MIGNNGREWFKTLSSDSREVSITFNPFHVTGLLYPLKITENQSFSYVFRKH